MEYHLTRKYIILLLSAAGILVLLVVGRAVYALETSDTVYPGVRVGAQDFSGMTREAVREKLFAFQSRLSLGGITIAYQDGADISRSTVIYPFVYKSDGADTRDFVAIDVDATADVVWKIGRRGGIFRKMTDRFFVRTRGVSVPAVVRIDEEVFQNVIRANVAPDEHPAEDAHLTFEAGTFNVAPERVGVVYTVENAVMRTGAALRKLELPSVMLDRVIDRPDLTAMDIMPFLPGLSRIVVAGSITITYLINPESKPWTLDKERIASLLTVARGGDGKIGILFEPALLETWVKETIAPDVEVAARDAKFKIEGNRVVEFESSQTGVAVDMQRLRADLEQTLHERYYATVPALPSLVGLAVVTMEPKVKTGDVNNLGIQEMLGTGVSSFRGSPANRIKNIRNGVNKLNGLLITPGEDFSLLAALRPFTSAGGYLPELVIKGDKIEPEIGGGLCQIGTTSFRMAMNSGLPITARTNHGLVVTYYNDPSNGNPGTDATIYDPAPDFKFLNDTGHYLLWTTHMDTATSKLEFTLWGTSDGRKGSYSAPVVQSWIPTGPMKEIETTDLPIGKRKCQSKHPGAVTSFTYTVALPNGDKNEKVYKSYYRPLPEICSVGVEKKTEDGTASAGDVVPADVIIAPVSVDDLG